MKQRIKNGLWILALLAAAAAVVLVARHLPSPQEREDLRLAVAGAKETLVQMGMFQSEDGLTASLPQEEVQALVDQYAQKVDRYYARGTYCHTFYPWLNQDYLTRTGKTVVDNCIAGGVSRCTLDSAFLWAGGERATVRATVTMWNKWVSRDQAGAYHAALLADQDYLKLDMVKEDGLWKLRETLDLQRGPNGSDPQSLALARSAHQGMVPASQWTLRRNSEGADLTPATPEQAALLAEIQQSRAIQAKPYQTYQAAKTAIQSISPETGTYLALLDGAS